MKDEKERAIQEKSKVKEKIFEERAKDLEDMNALALLLDELDRFFSSSFLLLFFSFS